MIKAEVTLLTINPNSKQPMPKENLYATALHEIGHAIKNHKRHLTISYSKNNIEDSNISLISELFVIFMN